ncbi:MAG: SDR family oxidoreductase [Alphaproteobacteria bacterium]|nr:SDR family oxidoreductase [Alphaproteobacteria bacterium]
MQLFDLSGKVALVTGSTRGIGEAIARRLAEHGAKVVVSSRKPEACARVASEINAAHGEGAAVPIPANINDKAQLQALVADARAALGRIDVLVCNAAINPYFGPSMGIPDDAFDKILGANLRSAHWLCQMVLPEMAARKDGVIIIVSSIAGIKGTPLLATYGLSKAADLQLARNIAVEYGPDNVRANCIAPGLVKTDFARALWENPEIEKQTALTNPLKRLGVPDDIAGAAVFLASRAGAWMTGQTLVIDGGTTVA